MGLKTGDVVTVENPMGACILKAHVEPWDEIRMEPACDHVGMDGQVYGPQDVACGFVDDEFLVNEWVEAHKTTGVGLVMVRKIEEEGFSHYVGWPHAGKLGLVPSKDPYIHADDGTGQPCCGAKLKKGLTKPAGRWDPWRGRVCGERVETWIWVPAVLKTTCPRCLARNQG